MNAKTKKWLGGCGIGCGVVLLLAIIGIVGSSFFFMRTFKEAIGKRELLDERHGTQAAYVPPVDGAISAERLEAFLSIRSVLMELCPTFANSAQQFQRMDELEEDTPKKETFLEVLKLSKEVFGMVPRMGEFFQARNTALLEHDMGLGEYTYIYTLVYRDRLLPGGTTEDSSLFGDGAPNRRLREALRQMLRNQLASLDEARVGETRQIGDRDLDLIRQSLQDEIDQLEIDGKRLPWQDGLPTAIAASIAPYSSRLDEVYCAATVGLELSKNRQKGLSIQAN
jgi:hypothetical protein